MKWKIFFSIKWLVLFSLISIGLPGYGQCNSDKDAIQVHIIGFGMNANDRASLEQAAHDGGATFEHVDDVSGLDDAIAAASGFGSVTTLDAEVEPNNNFGHANDIAPATLFAGTIYPKGDADWLRFRINHQGELQLISQSMPDNIDLVVRLWNANRDVIGSWQHALTVGGILDATFDLPAPGEYTIQVGDGRNDAESTDFYKLLLKFTPTADSGEQNNHFGNATPILLDTDIRANILPKGDSDWYQIKALEQGQLDIAFDPVPKNLDIVFRVWNEKRDISHNWRSPMSIGGPNIQSIDLQTPGIYTIEVRDGRNDARSIESYHLAMNFKASGDRSEPNNHFGQASLLDPNSVTRATILPKGDSDWYRIVVDSQGQLDVNFDPVPKNLDLVFRIWNTNRDIIYNWLSPLSVGGPNKQIIDLPSPGAYIMEVRDGKNDERSIEPYLLALKFTKTGDSAEPNNRFGDAARIALGRMIKGTILPKGDSDWYRIDVASTGNIEVSISNVDRNLDIVFRVWNANRDIIQNWVKPLAKGGNIKGVINLKEPGRYIIEVRDGRNDGRSIQPYELRTAIVGGN